MACPSAHSWVDQIPKPRLWSEPLLTSRSGAGTHSDLWDLGVCVCNSARNRSHEKCFTEKVLLRANSEGCSDLPGVRSDLSPNKQISQVPVRPFLRSSLSAALASPSLWVSEVLLCLLSSQPLLEDTGLSPPSFLPFFLPSSVFSPAVCTAVF